MAAEVLTVAEMYHADQLAISGGIPGESLMEAAGWAVAREVLRLGFARRVAVLCGPGNNGGDGFVAARLLAARGRSVSLHLLGDPAALKGDAAIMAERWRGSVKPLAADSVDGVDLVVDCLFGAGLARPLDGIAAQVVNRINQRKIPCVAVDVPSGVDGDSGRVLGCAPQALLTVTFFRKKPAHLLYPGRGLCGRVVVADIGIPDAVLDDVQPVIYENGPDVWGARLPIPQIHGHKYSRGHVAVIGGAEMTGAARLAARAARRAGAGLCTLLAPDSALGAYRAGDAGCIITSLDHFDEALADSRKNSWVLGPGGGGGAVLRNRIQAVLRAERACVLDADALACFDGCADPLIKLLSPLAVLTPHDGEYRKMFGEVEGSRLDRARRAAACSGAVVLLKGPDTVIADSGGRAVINAGAPPWLATAGSGDVLSGFIAGAAASGLDCFDASCFGAWLHGRAAQEFGPGLIAEDLAEAVPAVLADLYRSLERPTCA